jgi:hypothetical protein
MSEIDAGTNESVMWSYAFAQLRVLGDLGMWMGGAEKDDALEEIQVVVMIVSGRLKNGIENFHATDRDE